MRSWLVQTAEVVALAAAVGALGALLIGWILWRRL